MPGIGPADGRLFEFMLMSKVETLRGRELTPDDLEQINYHRELEFKSANVINLRPDNDEWEKLYFLVRDRGYLVAFGRLHDIDIEYLGTRHQILGIATIIATVRGRGYGSRLMTEIKTYVRRSSLSAIGFCNSSTAAFYQKCGYSILTDGLKYFTFRDAAGHTVPSRYASGDVLYIDGRDQLMGRVRQVPDERLIANRPEW